MISAEEEKEEKRNPERNGKRRVRFLSHVSLECNHIVVRLSSPCRSCNTKLQSRAQLSRHDLPINLNPFSVSFDLGMISFMSAAFTYFFD
jgi:hypothetical protein